MFLVFFLSHLLLSHGVEKPTIAVPKVDLEFWNNDTSNLWNNNCYNYSTNRLTHSFAQPGEASDSMYKDVSCEEVTRAATKDLGITSTDAFSQKSKSEDTLIALVVAPGYDFHWYRRDDNRFWSHKPGSTDATTKDQSDNVITDPEMADRGFYTEFCGYFKVKNYPMDSTEQNGGYVRIGNMTHLPELEDESGYMARVAPPQNSEVEILIYSGRKNPVLPLQAFLNSSPLEKPLKDLAQRFKERAIVSTDIIVPSRLGYNGILIHDRQGLLFPKGTSVHLKGTTLVAYSPGRSVKALAGDFSEVEKLLRHRF